MRPADRGVLLIEKTDRRGGEKEANDTLIARIGNEEAILERNGGNHPAAPLVGL
jgi:hypothetical protein